jgi:hypothetical protein
MRQRLIAAGCPVDPLDPEPANADGGLRIRPLSCDQNTVFDLTSFGGTGYTLNVEISNPHSRPFTVCEVAVELPWDDPQFYWLEDPRESVPALEEYFLSRQLTFPRTIVLNHLLLGYQRIRGYRVIAGLLLGRSFASIPEPYCHGTEVPAVLRLIDHADMEYTGKLSLQVDRTAQMQRGGRSKRKFSGLMGPGESERNDERLREMVGSRDAREVALSKGMRGRRSE